MARTRLLLIGAGKIGRAIHELLASSGDYQVTVADQNPAALADLASAGVATLCLEGDTADALQRAVRGQHMVVSAAPYTLTPAAARAACAAGAHYFDLTEDVAATRAVRQLAQTADTVLMPQCGLAPGFVGIVAHDLATQFEELHDLQMRVGALPRFPTNVLKYNLTWSTDGLINEYCNRCEAIVDGEVRELAALEGLEHFALDGVDYEAFNTSGGLGTLCDTLAGRVRNMDYKTVRYPGHRDIFHLLVNELKLRDRREMLKEVLETAIPVTMQDVVLVFVSASGIRGGRLTQQSYASRIHAHHVNGVLWSAIQITTASALCAAVELVREGRLPRCGFVRQEQIRLSDFLENRFGARYKQGQLLSQAA